MSRRTKELEKDKQKGKEQPQDYSLIDSPWAHCPSALELSSPGDSFHPLEDLDEPCTSLVELLNENESLHHTPIQRFHTQISSTFCVCMNLCILTFQT